MVFGPAHHEEVWLMKKNIRVVTPVTTKGLWRPEYLKALEAPGYEISVSELDSGPATIHCEFDDMLAVPDTVAKIIAAEREGADAVVIDCMGDPGLRAAREAVRIPVLGPCETSMHLAAMLGQKFSVVTILHRLRPTFENLAKLYGVHDKLVSVRSVEIPLLDLQGNMEATAHALTEQAILAVEQDSADVIILGCTGLLGYAEGVRKGLLEGGYDAPVIDPLPAAVKIAAAVVETGLSHSKLTYPAPPETAIVGFSQPEFSRRKG
jgi:allantoin racemase